MLNRPMAGFLLFFLPLLGCDSGTGPGREVEAALSVSPVSGDTDTDFVFNAGGSTSTGKAPSWEFRWDWNGDGVWDQDWSSASSQSHQYDTPGIWTVQVEARDRQSSDVATALVDVLPVVVAELEVSRQRGPFSPISSLMPEAVYPRRLDRSTSSTVGIGTTTALGIRIGPASPPLNNGSMIPPTHRSRWRSGMDRRLRRLPLL